MPISGGTLIFYNSMVRDWNAEVASRDGFRRDRHLACNNVKRNETESVNIDKLEKKPAIDHSKRLATRHGRLESLIDALKKKELPDDVVHEINRQIAEVNAHTGRDRDYGRKLNKVLQSILTLVQKKLHLVPRDHYRNMWMSVGLAAFGIPLGVAFGMSMDNLGLLGIGLPIGLVIGLAIGTARDKKARDQGKQLDVNL